MWSSVKPPRESFGDSGIDWDAAVGEADRLLAGTSSSGVTASQPQNGGSSNRATVSNGLADVSKRRKTETHNAQNQPPQYISRQNSLTDEQRARMEENRRRAMSKKQQMASSFPSNNNGCSSVYNDEQRARMEENRRMALDKKQQRSQASTASRPPPKASTVQCLSPSQRARMEENRRRALKRKQERLQRLQQTSNGSTLCFSLTTYNDGQHTRMGANGQKALEKMQQISQKPDSTPSVPPLPSATTQCPSFDGEQRMKMEENRRKALERKQHMSQLASAALSSTLVLPNSSTECSSATITDEQRQRMEGNRQKASERKHQMSQHTASRSAPSQQRDALDPSALSPSKMKPNNDEIDHHAPFRKSHEILNVTPPTDEKWRKPVEEDSHSAFQEEKLVTSVPPDNETKLIAQEPVASSASVSCEPRREKATAAPSPSKADASPRKKSALPQLPQDLQYEESRVLPVNDGAIDSLIENAELEEPLLNGWSLYDHQKEGVLRALRMRRLVLAFDMGLGKTIIGCVWAKAFQKTFEDVKIFVIAPVSLHDEWKRTAAEATGLKFKTNDKKRKKKSKKKQNDEDEDGGRTVTGKRRKKKPKKVEPESEDDESGSSNEFDIYFFSWSNICAYKEIISGIDEYVVICDEAHSMQSMASQRTEQTLKLVSRKRCRGVLLLSGTPMKNGRPSNLFPLLKAVKHPFGDHQKRFEFFFCNGHQKTMRGVPVWDANGSSNLKELNAHTVSHIFRMTKEECLTLPPKKREFKKIAVSSRHELRYMQALQDLAKAHTSSGEGESDELLSSFARLRQISSFAKVDATVSLSNTILSDESSIVIFTNFVAVAKEIYQKLEGMHWAGELLTGETVPKKRQAMVDRFQSGLSPAFVCTYGAGGVGLTLTAACTVVLVDRPWTPGAVVQAEDRVRRIGQRRDVRSIWIRAFPIDQQIDKLIDHKEVNSSTAVDGKDHSGGQNKSAPKVSIYELVKTVLSNNNDASE